jgi:hypothetical protein
MVNGDRLITGRNSRRRRRRRRGREFQMSRSLPSLFMGEIEIIRILTQIWQHKNEDLRQIEDISEIQKTDGQNGKKLRNSIKNFNR